LRWHASAPGLYLITQPISGDYLFDLVVAKVRLSS
jgi:hypothetical protein